MKKLLYTTTAFVLCGGIVQVNAACIATPSCTAMGYTSSSSCINGIKCPFGEYWNCANSDLSNKITELENKINSGAGTDPSDKTYDCKIGDIFYSDWTCSTDVVSGKTPIAVVVYMDGAGHGQALALNSIGKYAWQGGSMVDSEGNYLDTAVSNYSNDTLASQDFKSCINTLMLISSGTPNDFPAAWAANYYKTTGTKAGDWCLPGAGIIKVYYDKIGIIQNALNSVGGSPISFSSSFSSLSTWTSTEYDKENAFKASSVVEYKVNESGKNYNLEVRPVLEF